MNAAGDAALLRIDAPLVDSLVDNLFSDVDMVLLPDASRSWDDDTCYGGVEPSKEPFMDEIPYEELAFWLGSPTECTRSCPTCRVEPLDYSAPVSTRHQPTESAVHGHFVFIPSSRSRGLSTKIPVIAMPRIEGVNLSASRR